MRIRLELEIDNRDWERGDGTLCNDEEALELLNECDGTMWADMLYESKIKRVAGTNTFTGVL
jgi:hypothetical protein